MKTVTVKITDAVGKLLCHDVSRIVPGEFKGPRFRKGHIIREEDIEQFLLLGKEHVFVIELDRDEIHEDDAAIRLGRAAAGKGIELTTPVESKVNLISEHQGLLKINVALLNQVNSLQYVVAATLPTNTVVGKGEKVAGTKVIPLAVKDEIILEAERLMMLGQPLVEVKPFYERSIGLIITGNEIYHRRVEDAFVPVLTEKVSSFGSEVMAIEFAMDSPEMISNLIIKQIRAGADIIMVTGGLSVDPDDTTPLGIRQAGTDIIQYGAPVLPGAMFLLGYIGDTVILGIPACGMFYRTTVLDLILPRILAGEKVTAKDIQTLGHGGLCRSCDTCSFPICSFGTGGA